MTWIKLLPTVNASLNALSATFLLIGFFLVRRRKLVAHRKAMIAAVTTSTLFLISYLTYHYNAPATKFTGTGWVRPLYFFILISHIILAVVIVPLVVAALRKAFTGQNQAHRRIVRWAFPIWMYVSATGVLVYLFLYHLYPNR